MKYALHLFITIITLCLINWWYQIYISGHYYQNATLLLAFIVGIVPLVLIYLAYLLIRYIQKR